jgi:hypothetical protein
MFSKMDLNDMIEKKKKKKKKKVKLREKVCFIGISQLKTIRRYRVIQSAFNLVLDMPFYSLCKVDLEPVSFLYALLKMCMLYN